ncbi:metallophosphoesterase family protein [Salinigranum marinum]|uniref:metallophosphoesterase family protein n=1 Tax=Salinigranum marinum TaxID=1515595 RepID=UPI002989B10C|nr:metallophosphoesterase [Salinigranum marinum]
MTRVVVAGDVHLGSSNANADAFNGFLDWIYRTRDDVAELVLLGDVWDLVRRDPFGCAWETHDTIMRLKRLGEHLPVRIVLGNHDTYLRTLDASLYDVNFSDHHVVHQRDHSIRFCHGHAFDGFQFDRLSKRLSGPGDRGEIDPTNGLKDPVVAMARASVRAGTNRVRSLYTAVTRGARFEPVRYPRRERRAHAYLDTVPEDKLVYGHTHAPYVHQDNLAANPGSWKSTAPVHNTYLVIEAGHIELYRYRRDGDDEPIE